MIGEKVSLRVKIDIYLFPPTEERPYITAATVGMSALPLGGYPICEECAAASKKVHEHRSELLIYLDPNWDFGDLICRYPLLMMTYLARQPHLRDKDFGSGLSYEFPHEMVPEGSLLTNGYIMRPALEVLEGDFESFATVSLPDGPPCDLYWMIPITTAECYVKRTQGREALTELLLNNEYFCLDIDRQCYVEAENRHQRRAREKAQRTRAKQRPHTSLYEMTCEACGHSHDG
jgi:hypothetical protein